ncbi:MAG: hypothetical protein CMF61_08155 [Magnetococcales bacterium]|nr:hypothetical protein [Magnetococcales bacterium]
MKKIKLFTFLILTLKVVNPAFAQLSLTSPVQMNFGTIEFADAGGQNDVFLGTNGNVTYTNNFSGSGLGTPAELQILDTLGVIVQIGCDKNLTISNGISTVQVDRIEYVVGVGNGAPFGAGNACRGTRKLDVLHILTGNLTQDTILVGGRIRTSSSSVASGQWSSAQPGGSPVSFRVLVQ